MKALNSKDGRINAMKHLVSTSDKGDSIYEEDFMEFIFATDVGSYNQLICLSRMRKS
jgi:hypothetical protein